METLTWRLCVPQYQYGHGKDPLLPFTHWSSAKAAWCCESGRAAQCIPPDTLTVPEVVGTENWVTSNIPFLLDKSSIAKMQS